MDKQVEFESLNPVPTSDDFLDNQMVINYLSDGFLFDNIQNQISAPKVLNIPVDHLSEFEKRYSVLMDKYIDDIELSHQIKEIRKQTFLEITRLIEDNYNIASGLGDESLMTDILNVTTALYQTFVIDFKENLASMIFNYIIDNKEELIAYGNKVTDNIDITYNNSDMVDLNTLVLTMDYIIDNFSMITNNDYLFDSLITIDDGEFNSILLKKNYELGEITPKADHYRYYSNILQPGVFRDEVESLVLIKIKEYWRK